MVAKEHGAGNWRHSLDCPFSAPIEWPILKVGVVRDRRLERRGKKERRSENGIAVIIIVPSFHRLKLGNRINTNAGSGARGGRFAQAAADL